MPPHTREAGIRGGTDPAGEPTPEVRPRDVHSHIPKTHGMRSARVTLGLCPPRQEPVLCTLCACPSGRPSMRGPATLLTVALATLLAPGAGAPVQSQGSRNKLLLVSFDGFRWNYDQDVDTPNLDAMARDGVKARYMTPAFVTMTSPCHFTLVTGEYRPRMGPGGGRA